MKPASLGPLSPRSPSYDQAALFDKFLPDFALNDVVMTISLLFLLPWVFPSFFFPPFFNALALRLILSAVSDLESHWRYVFSLRDVSGGRVGGYP